MTRSDVLITDRGLVDSCLGTVRQLKVFTMDYQNLSWEQVWEAFTSEYPGKWAVQMFPPVGQLVNGKPVYHLFVTEGEPAGLNLRN